MTENNNKQNGSSMYDRNWDETSRMANDGTSRTGISEEEMYGTRQRHTRPQGFFFDNFGTPYTEGNFNTNSGTFNTPYSTPYNTHFGVVSGTPYGSYPQTAQGTPFIPTHTTNFTPGQWNNTPWNTFRPTSQPGTVYGSFDTQHFGTPWGRQFPVVPFTNVPFNSFTPETQFGSTFGSTVPYPTMPVSTYVPVPVTAFGTTPVSTPNGVTTAMPNTLSTFPTGTFNTGLNTGWSTLNKGKGPKNYRRSDERIKENICDLLSDDLYLDASDIELTVSNCEVTLTGTVSSRIAKRRAEDLAECVSGVTNVENRIRIVSEWVPSHSTSSSTKSSYSDTNEVKTKRSALATS